MVLEFMVLALPTSFKFLHPPLSNMTTFTGMHTCLIANVVCLLVKKKCVCILIVFLTDFLYTF